MEALRNFLKGWVGKGLLILFLLPLAITGFESIVRSGDDPNAVAKVGDDTISASLLQSSINQRREALLEQTKGDASLINNDALYNQILQSLVDRYLVIAQSKQLGFTASDATITQMLATEPTFLGADGKFSNELFANFLKSRNMTKDDLFNSIRQDLTVSTFSRAIINTGFYSAMGIDKLIGMQTKTRPVWVARIDWHSFLPKAQVSDAEINQYYQQHKGTLKSQETVDLSYIQLDKTRLNIAAPTEQELQQQYQTYLKSHNNQTEYELAMILMNGDKAQATLTSLKQQLDSNNADFATLAKQYSQDEGSKNDGGNIGPITPAMFSNDYNTIMSAVKSLKVGQVTPPIHTAYGYHLFKLVNINGATPPSFDSIKATLVQQVMTQKRESIYQDLIAKINNDAVAGASITEIANRYHLPAQTLKQYSRQHNQTVLNQPAIINAAFDPMAIQEGRVSVGIESAGKIAWVQPTHHQPEKLLAQAEAVPVIKAKLSEDKAKTLALTQAKAIAATIQATNKLDNAGISFEDLGVITRQDPRLLPEEHSAAFSQMTTGDKLAVTTQATSQGASILVGSAMSDDTSQLTADMKKQTAQMVRETVGQSQFEDYLMYLRSVTKVTIKPKAPQP